MRVPGKRVSDTDALKAPGDFVFEDARGEATTEPAKAFSLVFACPTTGRWCGGIRIGVKAKPPHGPSWEWDGNLDQPTLAPSINCVGGCKWHGFLRKGVWVDGKDTKS